MPANLWSQPIAPFRHSMQRLARPAGTYLAELDALETWCSRLVAPALPTAATLDSPFAGMHTPEQSAPAHGAASAAGRATPPVADRAMRRGPSALQDAPAAPSTHADTNPTLPTVAADGAAVPGASSRSLTMTPESGLRRAFPVRGKPASATAGSAGRTPAAPRPASMHPADQAPPALNASAPGPRLLRPEELLPRPLAAANAVSTPGDRNEIQPSSTAAAQPPASAPAAAALPEPPVGAAAGVDLLAALTAALYARPTAARTIDLLDQAAAGAIPWRVRAGHSPEPPATVIPSTPAAPAHGQTPPSARAMPEPLAPSTAQPSGARAAWSPTAQLSAAAALDPDLLADLVNEALLEQARRHGAHLP